MLGRAGREEIALLQYWPALAPKSSEKKLKNGGEESDG